MVYIEDEPRMILKVYEEDDGNIFRVIESTNFLEIFPGDKITRDQYDQMITDENDFFEITVVENPNKKSSK